METDWGLVLAFAFLRNAINTWLNVMHLNAVEYDARRLCSARECINSFIVAATAAAVAWRVVLFRWCVCMWFGFSIYYLIIRCKKWNVQGVNSNFLKLGNFVIAFAILCYQRA